MQSSHTFYRFWIQNSIHILLNGKRSSISFTNVKLKIMKINIQALFMEPVCLGQAITSIGQCKFKHNSNSKKLKREFSDPPNTYDHVLNPHHSQSESLVSELITDLCGYGCHYRMTEGKVFVKRNCLSYKQLNLPILL